MYELIKIFQELKEQYDELYQLFLEQQKLIDILKESEKQTQKSREFWMNKYYKLIEETM